MDRLPATKRARILALLCERVSISTVAKLLEDAGRACAAVHDPTVRADAGDAVALVDAPAAVPAKRGPYRTRPPVAELPNRPVTLTPGGTGGRPGWWSRGRAAPPA